MLAWDNETFKGRRFPRNCGPQGSREQRVASPEPKEGLCRYPTKGNAVRRNRQITIVGIADLVPILSLSLSHSISNRAIRMPVYAYICRTRDSSSVEVAAPAVKTSGYQVSPIVSSNGPCSVSSSSCAARQPARLFPASSCARPYDSCSLVAGGGDAGVALLRNKLNP